MTFNKHPLLTQIAGGVLGMTVATGVYFVLQALPSSTPVTALLVGADSRVTRTAARVTVNDKTVDPEVVKRLAAKAKQVVAQLNQNVDTTGIVPKATQSPMEDRTLERLARRQQLAQYAAIAQPTLTTATVVSSVPYSARVQNAPRSKTAMTIQQDVSRPVATATSSPALHASAQVEPPKKLSQTGVELPILAVLALIVTSSVYLLPFARSRFAMQDAKN